MILTGPLERTVLRNVIQCKSSPRYEAGLDNSFDNLIFPNLSYDAYLP